MRFLFPYHKIERNSSIILYGIGNVGRQFYRQLVQGKYCKIVGWSDRTIEGYTELQGKLIPPEKILEYEFDYLVIAVAEYAVAQEIKAKLIGMGIAPWKIVWEENYELYDMRWPDNTGHFIQNGDFFLKIMDIFCRSRQQFGEGKFYQSFPMLGLKGQRPTQERLESYRLKEVLKSHMDVLDIGCNCGFFDLQIADLVNTVTGLELNPDLVQIADITKQYLNKNNCNFLKEDFDVWKTDEKYDMIFAFAILCWIHLDSAEIADRLIRLSKSSGFVLIESHNIRSKDRLRDFELCIEYLKKNNMYQINQGIICDDGVIYRKFVLLRNGNAEG